MEEQLTSIATEKTQENQRRHLQKKGEADVSVKVNLMQLLFNGRTGQHLLPVPLIVVSHEDRVN